MYLKEKAKHELLQELKRFPNQSQAFLIKRTILKLEPDIHQYLQQKFKNLPKILINKEIKPELIHILRKQLLLTLKEIST